MRDLDLKRPTNTATLRRMLIATTACTVLMTAGAYAADASTASDDADRATSEVQVAQVDPAATPAPEADSVTRERIVVTATKRTQDLQDVPQAVTVIDEGFLKSINAASLEQFAAYVPSLDFQFFAPGQTRFTIRGVSPDEQTGDTTTSFYLDEIPLTSTEQRSQPDAHIYDIERVEILRGPQGTLYGEGAMGGTIRVITRKPDASEAVGSARASMGVVTDGDVDYSMDAMVNLPIVDDELALRVVGHTRQTGGWIDLYQADPLTGANLGLREEDANESRAYNVRAAARWEPGDNFTLDATYIHNLLKVQNTNLANSGDNHVWFDETPRNDKYDLWNATATWDLEPFTIVASSSFTDRESDRRDPEVGPLLGFTTSTVLAFNDIQSFAQEVRLVSADEGPFRWTIGGYYRDTSSHIIGDRETTPVIPGGVLTFDSYSDYNNKAIFGEVEYDLTDRLTILGGARAFWEEEDTHSIDSGLFIGPTPVFSSQSREDDDVNLKATISYDVSDETMVYATYAEGFRSGGFNADALGVGNYRPDKTGNYEVGVKYASDDGMLTVNAAAFYIDWKDLQFIQQVPLSIFTFVGNANEASSKGVELEVLWRPVEEAWISVGGNYTDAQLEADAKANLLPSGIIPAGTKLPGVPEYKISLAAGYDIPLWSDVLLSLSGGVNFVDDSFSKLEQGGSFTIPGFGTFTIGSVLPAYETANLRAQIGTERLSAALYVNNVFNERAKLGDDNFGFLFGPNYYWNEPRVIGVEVNFAF